MKQEHDYQAEMDLHAIQTACEIYKDKKRFAKCKALAEDKIKALEELAHEYDGDDDDDDWDEEEKVDFLMDHAHDHKDYNTNPNYESKKSLEHELKEPDGKVKHETERYRHHGHSGLEGAYGHETGSSKMRKEKSTKDGMHGEDISKHHERKDADKAPKEKHHKDTEAVQRRHDRRDFPDTESHEKREAHHHSEEGVHQHGSLEKRREELRRRKM